MLGEHALALAAGADQRDLDAKLFLDECDVPRSRIWKLRHLGDLVERFFPAGKRLVDRLAVMEVGLVSGKLVRLAAVPQPVADANG